MKRRNLLADLDLTLAGDNVRFYRGNARLLDPSEIVEELADRLNDEQMQRREAEERASTAEERASTAEERAATEATARASLEAQLAQMREELERLRRG